MTFVTRYTRSFLILATSVAAMLSLTMVLVSPAEADSTVNGPKLAAFEKPARRLSHTGAHAQSQRSAGFNHDRLLSSTHSVIYQPPGGTAGAFRAQGTTYVKVPFIELSAQYVDSDARVAWLGFTPYNAGRIRMTETWSTGGFKVSFNAGVGISGPSVGASVSGSGGTATDVTTVRNNWRVSSLVDSVSFGGVVAKVSHSVAGKFQFASAAYTVSTTASALV